MSTYGIPIPNVLYRSPEYAKLQFINDADILGYRIRVADTLDNAYGTFNGVVGTGTTAIFEVLRDQTFISKDIRQKGTGVSGDISRGQTTAQFNPNEYFGLANVPPDSNLWFLRVQVSTVATAGAAGSVQAGFPGGVFPGTFSASDQSDILIMQDPNYSVVPRPAMTLAGTAPDVGATAGVVAPPEALVFHVPYFADAMVFFNLGPGTLYISVGRAQPMMAVPSGATFSHTSGMKDEFLIAGGGSNPVFSMIISTVQGQR